MQAHTAKADCTNLATSAAALLATLLPVNPPEIAEALVLKSFQDNVLHSQRIRLVHHVESEREVLRRVNSQR
jgi:hypothetical protein